MSSCKSCPPHLSQGRSKFPPQLVAALCLAALLATGGYGLWFWHQQTRPGMVHDLRGMDDAAARHFRDAEHEWQWGIREDPTFPGCYAHLGVLYQQLQNYQGAAAAYATATRLLPNDGSLFKSLTAVRVAEGDKRDALPAAKRAYELLPQDAEVAGTYGDLAQQQGDRPAALTALRRANRQDPLNSHYLLALASVEMDLLDYADAEHDLASFLARKPNDPWACYLMAVVYNQKPRTSDNLHTAMGYAERSTRAGDPPLLALPLLAQLYLNDHRPAAALRICRQALQQAPNNTDILFQLVGCYSRLGQPKMADIISSHLHQVTLRHDRIEHLKHVMGFNHDDVAAGLELARLEEDDGDLPMAQLYYVQIVRDMPHDQRTHPALAAFLRRLGRRDLAKRASDPNFVP